MQHNIIIETHRQPDGSYRADVVRGPVSALGWWSNGSKRSATYQAAAAGVRETYPTLELFFLHAKG